MLTAIRVENWFHFEKAELLLSDPLTIVTGAHKAGKSALAHDAVEWAITGGLESRKRLMKRKLIPDIVIRKGAKTATVVLEFSEDGKVSLVVSRSVDQRGRQTLGLVDANGEALEGSLDELQRDLYARLKLSPVSAVVALNTWAYFDQLDDAARASVLFRTLRQGVDVQRVTELLGECGADEKLAGKYAKAAVQTGFEPAQKMAEKARAEQTGTVRGIQLETEERQIQIGGRPIDLDTIDPDTFETKRFNAHAELEEMAVTAGEALGKAKAGLADLNVKRDGLEKEREKLGTAPNLTRKRKKRVEQGAEFDTVNARYNELEEEHEKLRFLAETDAKRWLTAPEACPVISGFRCPATAAALRKHRDELVPQIAKAGADLERLETSMEEVLGKRSKLQDVLIVLDREVAEGEQHASQLELIESRLKLLEEPIRLAESAITDTRRFHATEGDRFHYDADEAEALRERIKLNEEVIRAHAAWKGQCERNEEGKARQASAASKREALDAIAQALKPDGIPKQLIVARLPELQASMDEIAGPTGLGDVVIDPDDYEIAVTQGKTHFLEPQLAETERLRFAIAVQHSIATRSGLGVLIVDQADRFIESELRKEVLLALVGVAAQHGRVVAIAASRVTTPVAPPHEEIGMAWIHDGKVEAVS